MNKKGSVLIVVLLVVVALSILSTAIMSRSISENNIARKSLDSNQAFWLAEAGISRAVNALRISYDTTGPDYANIGQPGSEIGGCSFVSSVNGLNRLVTAIGCVPAACNCNPSTCRVIRTIEAMMNQYQVIPAGFYDHAIYSAGNINIGSNCPVDGNVFSGADVDGVVENPHTITENDPTLHEEGLPALTFADLRQKSIDQGWYNPVTKITTYPTDSFYNSPGIPNVVFIDGDFTLVGGKQVVKGFIVVGGDLVYNAEIGGNATVDGCLYTRGNIWLHGGGGKIINVNGGLWAGGTVTLNGNEEIIFNQDYMNAIRDGLHPNADVRIISWKEQSGPYRLGS